MDNYQNYQNLGEYDNIETEEDTVEEEEIQTVQPLPKIATYVLGVNSQLTKGLHLC